jgi:hypothetical protein
MMHGSIHGRLVARLIIVYYVCPFRSTLKHQGRTRNANGCGRMRSDCLNRGSKYALCSRFLPHMFSSWCGGVGVGLHMDMANRFP